MKEGIKPSSSNKAQTVAKEKQRKLLNKKNGNVYIQDNIKIDEIQII